MNRNILYTKKNRREILIELLHIIYWFYFNETSILFTYSFSSISLCLSLYKEKVTWTNRKKSGYVETNLIDGYMLKNLKNP